MFGPPLEVRFTGGDTILAECLGVDRIPSPADVSNSLITMSLSGGLTVLAADANGSRKTAEIVILIEFLLEYDTAGDPIAGLKWSRRTTEGSPWRWAISVSPSVPAPSLVYSIRWAILCASITSPCPPMFERNERDYRLARRATRDVDTHSLSAFAAANRWARRRCARGQEGRRIPDSPNWNNSLAS